MKGAFSRTGSSRKTAYACPPVRAGGTNNRLALGVSTRASTLAELHVTMPTPVSIAFAQGASAYKKYLDSPHGRLRLEIAWRQLSNFVEKAYGPHPRPFHVLDLGCGTGEVALRLAARGHVVTLLDSVAEMLDLAADTLRRMHQRPPIAPAFVHASIEDAPDLFEGKTFDLLLCHTVVEYFPQPESALIPVRSLLKPGGFLSLVTLNGSQEPFRLAIRDHKLDEARKALAGGGAKDSLFGLPRKSMVSDDVRAQLEASGIEVIAHEGIVVFSDYLPSSVLEDDSGFTTLLNLEVEAGTRSPFNELARYLHFWGRRAR